MKIFFQIAIVLLLMGATAQTTAAMTPIPDKDINGYIIRSNGAEAGLIPAELNNFLLGKVFTGSSQALAAAKLKLSTLYPIDAENKLLLVDVMGSAGEPAQTYALTMYGPAPGKWKFLDGALIKQTDDINAFVNEIKYMMQFDDVKADHHEVHAEPTAVNVTRSYDIKIFLADVGMETYSNDVTFNYLVDPKTKVLCMADTNSSGSIYQPEGPAMMQGAPRIPASTRSVGAMVPALSLELLQVMCSPVSDGTRVARWSKLATEFNNVACNDEMMAQTAAILLRQAPEQFVKVVDPADEAAKKFIVMALAQDSSLKNDFKTAIKRAPRSKSKAWKKLL